MDNETLLKERIQLIRDASHLNNKNRIPHVSFYVTWKVHDAGYKLSEALDDYEIMEKCVREHQERYNFDAFLEFGNRNQYKLSKALGSSNYIVDDEKGSVAYLDDAICTHDELHEYAQDIQKFVWEKGMAHKYNFWNEPVSIDFMNNLVKERNGFINYSIKIGNIMKNEYGIPATFGSTWYVYSGMDVLFNTVRGIKGLAIDMRKNDGYLDEAIAALNEITLKPNLAAMDKAPDGPNMNACFDNDATILVQNILNPKQLEKYYWPYLKEILDLTEKKGMTTRLFTEGSGRSLWNYLSDYKPGTIILHPELDDAIEAKRALPNVSILGGVPIALLGRGSIDDCLNVTKKLVNEIGPALVLSQDKMGSYPFDTKRENLLAVCDYIQNYRL